MNAPSPAHGATAFNAAAFNAAAFKYDPFANFFEWLKHNQTSWCVTAADFYETMLEKPGVCPGTLIHPTFCDDFVQSYESQCNPSRDLAVSNQLLLCVFAVALGCAIFAGWTGRRTQLVPESGVCIFVGLAAGTMLYSTANKENNNAASAAFDPSIFFLVLIPPIALNALLEVEPRHFTRNFPSIMWLAGMQTILSCVTVGVILNARFPDFGMPACLLVGAIASAVDPTALREALARKQSLLLHELSHAMSKSRIRDEDGTRSNLSHRRSTTQALVQSLQRRSQQLKDLDATIFGESTLNDGVSFVLFSAILPLVTGTPPREASITPAGSSSFSLGTSPSSLTPLERTAAECIGDFFTIYGTSFGIGLVSGLFSALLFKSFVHSCGLRIDRNAKNSEGDETKEMPATKVEEKEEKEEEEEEDEGDEGEREGDAAGIRGVVVFITLALLPYYLCELYEMSGLVGLVSSTFFMSSFTMHSLARQQQQDVRKVVGTLSKLTEMFVFSYTGFCISAPFAPADIAVEDVKFKWDPTFVLWVAGANLAGRLWVFVLGGVANMLRRPGMRYECRDLFVLFWSSLRGPVCFALGMGIPRYNHVTRYGSTKAPLIAASLTALVVGTVFLFGGTSGVVLSCLYRDGEKGAGFGKDTAADSFVVEAGESFLASGTRPLPRSPPKKGCLWRQATNIRRAFAWLHLQAFQVLVAAPERK